MEGHAPQQSVHEAMIVWQLDDTQLPGYMDPHGITKVLLCLRDEVWEDTNTRIPIHHVFSPFNLQFCQGYAILSHTCPKLHPPVLFIINKFTHALRKFGDETDVFITWFVSFTVGNEGGEGVMCENKRKPILVFTWPATVDMQIMIPFIVLAEYGGLRDC